MTSSQKKFRLGLKSLASAMEWSTNRIERTGLTAAILVGMTFLVTSSLHAQTPSAAVPSSTALKIAQSDASNAARRRGPKVRDDGARDTSRTGRPKERDDSPRDTSRTGRSKIRDKPASNTSRTGRPKERDDDARTHMGR